MASAITGPDGKASFQNVPLGKYKVEVKEATGYRLPPAQEAALAQDGQTIAVSFLLEPQSGAIDVVVGDASGPLAGARVEVTPLP